VVVTAQFRILDVFVIMELGSRKTLHHNVTKHPASVVPSSRNSEASEPEPVGFTKTSFT